MWQLTDLSIFFLKLKEKKREKKMLGKPARSLVKFKNNFPNYVIGINNYGVPTIRNPHADAQLTIGSYCSIAPNVKIYMSGMHRTDWVTTYPFPAFISSAKHIKDYEVTKGNVTIGSDVWLCANSVILSGVTIGHGAVVANSAIVTKDVPPYAIFGGNPAKLIRYRFDEKTREALLQSAWWDWPEDEVLNNIYLLCNNDIDKFIQYAISRAPSTAST